MATMDKGTDYRIFDHTVEAQQSKTLFNMSYLHTYNCDFAELRPFYLQETVPGDKFTLSNDIMVRVQPMEVPVMSRMKVYTHYYYMRNSDAWADWNYFITRGRTGNYETPFPHGTIRNFKELDPDNSKWYGAFTEESLANAIGIPIMQYYYNGEGSWIEKPKTGDTGKNQIWLPTRMDYPVEFSIIPFFMYQRIYRDYYMNKNLNQNDKVWFPDNDNEFMLGMSYSKNVNQEFHFLPTADPTEQIISEEEGTYKRDYSLYSIRYRNWRDDYFTSAMPWPQRGRPPELDLEKTIDIDVPKRYIYSDGSFITGEKRQEKPVIMYPWYRNNMGDDTSWFNRIGVINKDEPTGTINITQMGNDGLMNSFLNGSSFNNGSGAYINNNGSLEYPDNLNANGQAKYEALHTKPATVQVPISVTLTMEKLRLLSILQLWQERNGRTDGDYNSMIQMHFGHNPHQQDHSPIYIGGTVQDIVVTEIIQTSETTEESALGDGAGHGISVANGYVGEFNCPDYGWIMGIMSIMPDVTYSEGLPRELSRETFAEYYWPEFNGLGPQGILKKELMIGGSDDDELWAYQERYAEMKHRRNRVSGALANKHDEYFSRWTMNRFFDERPEFNQKFVNGKDTVRHDVFTMYEETPFTIQVANIARAVRPIPYKSIPKGLI